MGLFTFIVVVSAISTVGSVANNYIKHRQKLAEMKFKSLDATDAKTAVTLKRLEEQIADLRDTTTKYDVSFDSALQRMESRLNHVEQRMSTSQQVTVGERTSGVGS